MFQLLGWAFLCVASAPVLAQPTPLPFREWTASRPDRFVVDGALLKASGGYSFARARRPLVDFEVGLEFRPATEKAEGAVVVRGARALRKESLYAGYRVSLSYRDGKLSTTVKGISKRVRPVTTPIAASTRPRKPDDWHALVVRCYDDRVTVSVDGDIVADVIGEEPLAGFVGIETRDGAIEYRAVQVEPLSYIPATSSAPARPTDAGVTLPKPIREVRPRYTADALEQRVNGKVWIEAVIMPDGRVGATTVTKSVQPDLDAEAVAAARRWTFVPGQVNGRPAAVLVTIEITFMTR